PPPLSTRSSPTSSWSCRRARHRLWQLSAAPPRPPCRATTAAADAATTRSIPTSRPAPGGCWTGLRTVRQRRRQAERSVPWRSWPPDQARLVSPHRDLYPVTRTQFRQHRADILLHRRYRKKQPLTDLDVRQALTKQRHNLPLPRTQSVHRPPRLRTDPRANKPSDHCSRHLRRQHRPAAVQRADRLDQVFRLAVLQQESGRAAPQRGRDMLIGAER